MVRNLTGISRRDGGRGSLASARARRDLRRESRSEQPPALHIRSSTPRSARVMHRKHAQAAFGTALLERRGGVGRRFCWRFKSSPRASTWHNRPCCRMQLQGDESDKNAHDVTVRSLVPFARYVFLSDRRFLRIWQPIVSR